MDKSGKIAKEEKIRFQVGFSHASVQRTLAVQKKLWNPHQLSEGLQTSRMDNF